MSEPMLYTVKAFCAAHAMGITHFYKLVNAGQIATVTTQGRRLVPVESARAYRASLTLDCIANSDEGRRTAAKAVVKKTPLRQANVETDVGSE